MPSTSFDITRGLSCHCYKRLLNTSMLTCMLSILPDTPVQPVLTIDYDGCHFLASVLTKAFTALPGRWQIHSHIA